MHATLLGRSCRRHPGFFIPSASFVALWLIVPPTRADETSAKVDFPISDPASNAREEPGPSTIDASNLGILMRKPEVPARSALAGPDSASLEISKSVPFISKIADMNVFTGVYEFDEGPDDSFTGARAGVDFALTNRIRLEASYQQDQDLRRNNGFVGFWASIPLRDKDSANYPAEPEATPQRTLVAAIAGDGNLTRNRTSRKPDDRGGRFAFLTRLLPGLTASESTDAPEEAKSTTRNLFGRKRK